MGSGSPAMKQPSLYPPILPHVMAMTQDKATILLAAQYLSQTMFLSVCIKPSSVKLVLIGYVLIGYGIYCHCCRITISFLLVNPSHSLRALHPTCNISSSIQFCRWVSLSANDVELSLDKSFLTTLSSLGTPVLFRSPTYILGPTFSLSP